jgi:hypothetical protein
MKRTTRQFEVVPVAVVLQKARLLEDANYAKDAFQKRCTSATDPSRKAPPLRQGKDRQKSDA